MKKREAEFQTKFNRWVRRVWRRTSAFELKVTTRDSISFSSVKFHQVDALLAAKNGVFVYKIPDTVIGSLPFDSFCLAGVQSFIVLLFNADKPGQTEFFLIDADIWDMEDKNSKRRSLTEERAGEIGQKCTLDT